MTDAKKNQIVNLYTAICKKINDKEKAKGKDPDYWYESCKKGRAEVANFAQNQDSDVSRQDAFYTKLILNGASNGIAAVKNGWLAIKKPDKKPDATTVARIFKDLVSLASNSSQVPDDRIREIVENTRIGFFSIFSNFHPYAIFNRALASVLGERVSVCCELDDFFKVYDWFVENSFITDSTKRKKAEDKSRDWFSCNVKLMSVLWECLKKVPGTDNHRVGIFVRHVYACIEDKTITDIARSAGIQVAEDGRSNEELSGETMSDLYWLVASYKEWGRYVKDMPVNSDQSYSVKDKKGKNKKYFPGIQDGDLVVAYQKAEEKPEPGVSTQAIVSILQCARDLNGETVKFKKVRDLKNPIRIDFTKIKKDKDNPLSRSEVIQMNCNGSLYRLTEAEADAVMKMINDSEGENVFAQSNGVNKEVKSLLKSNLQVILTGAPGTGKTYAAKKVAMDISKDEWVVEDGEWKYGQIASVQFHPGYDYSDFVIGMKPVLVTEEGKEVFRDADGKLYTTDNNDPNGAPKQFIDKKGTYVSYDWKDGVFKEFAAKAKKAYDDAVNKKKDPPKYVFLIDEINRADLSRVFGELFSLLEEEYRYPNGKGSDFILLPNGERFSIPKNLYIIGTMNDIDRSVESMDFALRRRFAWYEVKPQDPNSTELDAIIKAKQEDGKISKEEAKKLDKAMKALNKLIAPPLKKENEDGTGNHGGEDSLDLRLGSEYQLGGAIFAKLEKYVKNSEGELHDADIDEFEKLWSFHIKNILSEYLRGRSNREILLCELEQKYYAAIKGEPPKKTASPNGESVTDDPNPATGSEPQD